MKKLLSLIGCVTLGTISAAPVMAFSKTAQNITNSYGFKYEINGSEMSIEFEAPVTVPNNTKLVDGKLKLDEPDYTKLTRNGHLSGRGVRITTQPDKDVIPTYDWLHPNFDFGGYSNLTEREKANVKQLRTINGSMISNGVIAVPVNEEESKKINRTDLGPVDIADVSVKCKIKIKFTLPDMPMRVEIAIGLWNIDLIGPAKLENKFPATGCGGMNENMEIDRWFSTWLPSKEVKQNDDKDIKKVVSNYAIIKKVD